MKGLLAAIVMFALAGAAHAEPYLALREGYKCSQCHVNKTGGGMRTSFGSIYAQTRLPSTVLGAKDDAGDSPTIFRTAEAARYLRSGPFFDTWLADRVAIGGDFRTRYTQTRTPQAKDSSSFDVQEGRAYLQFDLVPDAMTFYVDETLGPGSAGSREIFALFTGLPYDGWIKAGKFLTPYGIRIYDDTSFIRETTGFNYNTPDNGVEFGFERGVFSAALAIQNGTAGGPEDNQSKLVSLVMTHTFSDFRLGDAVAYNPSSTNRRFVFGEFAGVQLGRLGVIAEADLIRDENKDTGDVKRQLATFLETDLEVCRGVNLRTVIDFLDPDKAIGENARTRFSVGAQWFVTPSVELNLFLKLNDSVPQHPEEKTDFLIGELHLFF
ncbi:MAG: hypothetical protein HY292_27415 [Planctomycetes bacterium]|nr:hypothetical protein [Planctomycetota bacterium]